MKSPSAFRRRALVVAAAVGVATAAFVSLYLGSWTFRRGVDGVVSGDGVVRFRDTAERLVVAEDPVLIADYYASGHDRALILLVHGSSRAGRKSGLVRLMAARLQREGFPVLALDLEGFGDSEDPELAPGTDFRFEHNVIAAARLARARGLAPGGRIVYFGHSLGAGVVLRAGRLDPRPIAVVASGAPFFGPLSGRTGFFAGRLQDMEIPVGPVALAAIERYLREMDPLAELARGGHAPTLFIFGGDAKILPFAREHLPPPGSRHGLFVAEGAPHGYHIVGGRWGLVFFDEEVLESVVRAAAGWALEWGGGPDGP